MKRSQYEGKRAIACMHLLKEEPRDSGPNVGVRKNLGNTNIKGITVVMSQEEIKACITISKSLNDKRTSDKSFS